MKIKPIWIPNVGLIPNVDFVGTASKSPVMSDYKAASASVEYENF